MRDPLVDRIAEVLREHRLSTTAWGQTHCWCQQDIDAEDFGMAYGDHAAHVASVLEAQLELTEEAAPSMPHWTRFVTPYAQDGAHWSSATEGQQQP